MTDPANAPGPRGRGRPPTQAEAHEASRHGRRIAAARAALDQAMDDAVTWVRDHPGIAETHLSAALGVNRTTLRGWKKQQDRPI